MKIIHSFFLIGCILLFFISCQSKKTDELNDSEKSKITQEIESLVDHFFNPDNLNYTNHVDLRANEEGYVFAGDGKIQHTDYESYRSATQAAFKDIQHFTEVKRTRTLIYVLSREASVCTVEFKGKFLTTAGDTITHNGCWTMVFKAFPEGWKIIHENGTHTQ